MATHSIAASGGDFSTVQAWEDDIPGTLTEQRIGECNNEEFLVAAGVVNFSAHTTTSSFDIVLRCQTGDAFNDNANVRTNLLRYNASNGAGLRCTDAYACTIRVSGAIGHLTVQNLQLRSDAPGSTPACIFYDNFHACTLHLWKNIIADGNNASISIATFSNAGASDVIRVVNGLFINRSTGGDGIRNNAGDNQYIHCATVRPNNITAGGVGFMRVYGTPIMTNCAVFGYSTTSSTGYSGSSSNNATNLASGLPGSSNQHSVTYNDTTPFVLSDDANPSPGIDDWRLADNANSLINNGVLDATNAPNDISNTVRANPPEIGVWELVAAATKSFPHSFQNNLGNLMMR